MQPPSPDRQETRNHRQWIPAACVLAGSILYSGKGLFGKAILLSGASVADLMAMRTAWAAPFYLVVLVWFLRSGLPAGRDALRLLAWGVLGFWLAPRLTFEGLGHTSAGLERILIQTSPAWIVALVWATRGRRPSRRVAFALVLCYAGLLVACLGRDGVRSVADPVGVGLILCGCFLWSVFVVHVGSLQDRCGVGVTTSAGMLVSAVLSLGESAFQGRLDVVAHPTAAVIPALAGLVVFSTVVPSFLTQAGLHRLGPVRTGLLSLAGPALVPIAAAVFLGERMSLPQIAGLAVVVLASVPLSLQKG